MDTYKSTCYNVNVEKNLLQGGWDDQKRTDKTLKECKCQYKNVQK